MCKQRMLQGITVLFFLVKIYDCNQTAEAVSIKETGIKSELVLINISSPSRSSYFKWIFIQLLIQLFLWYGPRFLPSECTSLRLFGIPSTDGLSLVAQSILFRVYSKFDTPLDARFRSFGRLLKDSIGPLDKRFTMVSSVLIFCTRNKPF